MIVYQYMPDWYIASYKSKGKYYNGYGRTHAEAIISLLKTI